MLNKDNYQIPPVEMAVTVVSMLLAIGILTLPRTLADTLETGDGWLSVLLSGATVMGIVFLIVRLQKFFPGQSLLQFIGESGVGKWIAKILALLFFLYFIILLAFEARVLTIIVRMYLLDRTPPEITLGIILLTSAYAVSKGVQGIVHLNIMFAPFIIIVYFTLIVFNVGNMDVTELLPVLPLGIMPVLASVPETIHSYLGIELLFFWLAYMKATDLKVLPLNIGIMFVTLVYFLILIVTYSVLSVDGVKSIVFPVVGLAKEVEIVEGLIERFEPLMIVIWIIAIFTTMAIVHLLAVQTIKKEFVKKKGIIIPATITLIAYYIAFAPNSIEEVYMLGGYVSNAGLTVICLSLLVGYLSVWLKKKKQSSPQQSKGLAK
ncbi:GerAB/ArcD/ProY family transporter [Halalkalibacter krulwichiae]|uniref:Spore germination protein YndE n=1 Tax=Halalkalibacter krulwichiae TaxID=199441 RepID=A0A1X9MF83_9BACI|nr:GerAB/ArcD/ProY family transporter [Halalkalibacter krulwichiae]ARK30181.1 Spore germination protein YndE [Halalkalibacter krulwichiae]